MDDLGWCFGCVGLSSMLRFASSILFLGFYLEIMIHKVISPLLAEMDNFMYPLNLRFPDRLTSFMKKCCQGISLRSLPLMTNDLRRGHVRSQAHWLAKSSSILRKSSRLSNPCFLLTLKVINVLRMYGSSVRRYLFSSRLVDFLRFSQSLWSLRKVPTYNRGTMTCEVASNLIFIVYNVTLRKA
jgi:hypothetical protein